MEDPQWKSLDKASNLWTKLRILGQSLEAPLPVLLEDLVRVPQHSEYSAPFVLISSRIRQNWPETTNLTTPKWLKEVVFTDDPSFDEYIWRQKTDSQTGDRRSALKPGIPEIRVILLRNDRSGTALACYKLSEKL